MSRYTIRMSAVGAIYMLLMACSGTTNPTTPEPIPTFPSSISSLMGTPIYMAEVDTFWAINNAPQSWGFKYTIPDSVLSQIGSNTSIDFIGQFSTHYYNSFILTNGSSEDTLVHWSSMFGLPIQTRWPMYFPIPEEVDIQDITGTGEVNGKVENIDVTTLKLRIFNKFHNYNWNGIEEIILKLVFSSTADSLLMLLRTKDIVEIDLTTMSSRYWQSSLESSWIDATWDGDELIYLVPIENQTQINRLRSNDTSPSTLAHSDSLILSGLSVRGNQAVAISYDAHTERSSLVYINRNDLIDNVTIESIITNVIMLEHCLIGPLNHTSSGEILAVNIANQDIGVVLINSDSVITGRWIVPFFDMSSIIWDGTQLSIYAQYVQTSGLLLSDDPLYGHYQNIYLAPGFWRLSADTVHY